MSFDPEKTPFELAMEKISEVAILPSITLRVTDGNKSKILIIVAEEVEGQPLFVDPALLNNINWEPDHSGERNSLPELPEMNQFNPPPVGGSAGIDNLTNLRKGGRREEISPYMQDRAKLHSLTPPITPLKDNHETKTSKPEGILGVANEMTQSLKESVEENLRKVGQKAERAYDRGKEIIKETVDSSSDAAKEAGNRTVQKAKEDAQWITNKAVENVNWAQQKIQDVSHTATDDNVKEEIGRVKDKAAEKLEGSARQGAEWTKDKAKKTANKAMNKVEDISKKAKENKDWVKNSAAKTKDRIKEGNEWSKDKLNEGKEWAKDKLNEEKEWAKDKLNEEKEWAKDKLNEEKEWAKDKLNEEKEWAKDKLNEEKEWAKDKLNEEKDWAKDKLNEGWDRTKDSANKNKEWAKNRINEDKEWAKDKLNEEKDWAKDKLNEGWNKTKDSVNTNKEWAKNRINEDKEWAKDKMKEGWEKSKDRTNEGKEWAKDRANEDKELAIKGAQKKRDSLSDEVKGIQSRVSNKSNEGIEKAKMEGKSIKDKIIQNEDWIVTKAKEEINLAKQAVNNAKEKVMEEGELAKNKLIENERWAIDKAKQPLYWIVQLAEWAKGNDSTRIKEKSFEEREKEKREEPNVHQRTFVKDSEGAKLRELRKDDQTNDSLDEVSPRTVERFIRTNPLAKPQPEIEKTEGQAITQGQSDLGYVKSETQGLKEMVPKNAKYWNYTGPVEEKVGSSKTSARSYSEMRAQEKDNLKQEQKMEGDQEKHMQSMTESLMEKVTGVAEKAKEMIPTLKQTNVDRIKEETAKEKEKEVEDDDDSKLQVEKSGMESMKDQIIEGTSSTYERVKDIYEQGLEKTKEMIGWDRHDEEKDHNNDNERPESNEDGLSKEVVRGKGSEQSASSSQDGNVVEKAKHWAQERSDHAQSHNAFSKLENQKVDTPAIPAEVITVDKGRSIPLSSQGSANYSSAPGVPHDFLAETIDSSVRTVGEKASHVFSPIFSIFHSIFRGDHQKNEDNHSNVMDMKNEIKSEYKSDHESEQGLERASHSEIGQAKTEIQSNDSVVELLDNSSFIEVWSLRERTSTGMAEAASAAVFMDDFASGLI